MKQPDSLIKKMQNGDQRAFSILYDNYSEALLGIIFSIVQNEGVAEEILQDVFIKIWDNAGRYDPEKGRFFTWILNIARNKSIDYTRSKASKNAKKNFEASSFVDILVSSDNLERKTNSIGMQKLIEALKPACIKIIDLLYFKGFTQSDASKALDIPLGTLKTRNRMCINDLRKMINK